MHRWQLRFIVRFEDGEYVAETIDAGAVGMGATTWDATTDLTEMVMVMAQAAVDEKLQLKVEPEPDDERLFQSLEAGEQPPVNVVRWGRITVTLGVGTAPDVEEVHLAGAA